MTDAASSSTDWFPVNTMLRNTGGLSLCDKNGTVLLGRVSKDGRLFSTHT